MILTEHRPKRLPISRACEALGLTRSSVYQSREAKPYPRAARQAGKQPRALTPDERSRVQKLLYSEEFRDQPPREVYAELLDRGLYLCSSRTMYRILKDVDATTERRVQRAKQQNAVPHLKATAVHEVWCWDVTKLRCEQGQYYSLSVVIDLYSRYILAWMVSTKENTGLACQLMETAVDTYGIEPSTLTVHQDRGSPMTAHRYLGLMEELGVTCSHSRPRVSNDNPFSESQFKTMKYQPDYPKRFTSVAEARIWCAEYVRWYNEDHYHTGLNLYTPAQVFTGEYIQIAEERDKTLEIAFTTHANRFVHGQPKVKRPPSVVKINPLTQEAIDLGVTDMVNIPTLNRMRGKKSS